MQHADQLVNLERLASSEVVGQTLSLCSDAQEVETIPNLVEDLQHDSEAEQASVVLSKPGPVPG